MTRAFIIARLAMIEKVINNLSAYKKATDIATSRIGDADYTPETSNFFNTYNIASGNHSG
jgi:flagellin-like hook-associated protein FlgL